MDTYQDAAAVLIASTQLGCDVWFAFKKGWTSGDKLAVYYASELPVLRMKTQTQLIGIHKSKLAMPGSVIRK